MRKLRHRVWGGLRGEGKKRGGHRYLGVVPVKGGEGGVYFTVIVGLGRGEDDDVVLPFGRVLIRTKKRVPFVYLY